MPVDSQHKKTTSEAQKEASRRNGARSHGPTSAEGRRRAALSRLEHGLCSEKLFLPGEDPRDYELLRQGYLDDWNPQSATAIGLVDKLARADWFLRRADRSNHARVCKAMRNAPLALDAARLAEHTRLVDLLPDDPRAASALLRQNGPGCRFLIGRFETLLQALDLRGWWEPSERVQALEGFGKRTAEVFDDDLVHEVCYGYLALGYQHWSAGIEVLDVLGLSKPEEKGAEWEFRRRLARLEAGARKADGETVKQAVRGHLTREIAALKTSALEHEAREAADRADASQCEAVDVSPAGQALSRHEAKYHRQFFAALRALMALTDRGFEPAVEDGPVLQRGPEGDGVSSSAPETGTADEPERPREVLEMCTADEPERPLEVLETGTADEPEPPAAAAPEPAPAEPKLLPRVGIGEADPEDEPGPEMFFSEETQQWYERTETCTPEAVAQIEENRRRASVWSDRDFVNCTPEVLAHRRYCQSNGYYTSFEEWQRRHNGG